MIGWAIILLGVAWAVMLLWGLWSAFTTFGVKAVALFLLGLLLGWLAGVFTPRDR
jgi:hypothetical protein